MPVLTIGSLNAQIRTLEKARKVIGGHLRGVSVLIEKDWEYVSREPVASYRASYCSRHPNVDK